MTVIGVINYLALAIWRVLIAACETVQDWLTRKPKSVEGLTVVITGAAGGIGCELARIFSEHKAKVVLLDLAEQLNEELAGELNQRGGTAYAYSCDVTNPAQMESIAQKIQKNPNLGDPDIVISNAGVLVVKSLMELSEAEIRRTIDINVLGCFWTVRAFLPRMLENNAGHLVTISSVGGHFGAANSTDYSASKFAVRGLMESIEWELRHQNKTNIRLTTVYPFFTRTPLLKHVNPVSKFLKILEPVETAEGIFKAVCMEETEYFVPKSAWFLSTVLKAILPHKVKIVVNEMFGGKYHEPE